MKPHAIDVHSHFFSEKILRGNAARLLGLR